MKIQGAEDLYGAPFYILYDPALISIAGMREGDFLRKKEGKTVFLYKVDPENGRIMVGLSRLGKGAGVSGSGILAFITFKALKSGKGNLSFAKEDFQDSQRNATPVRSREAQIRIK